MKASLLVGHTDPSCRDLATRWHSWAESAFASHRPALVDLSADYLTLIDRKSRNMVRKPSSRGYLFGEYDYNEHLADMDAIDSSKSARQGRPMSSSYKQPHAPSSAQRGSCSCHSVLNVGAIKDGTLFAYSQLVICGEAAIMNRFIGHAEALRDGVANGLIAELVRISQERGALWLNYLRMESATQGLTDFKLSTGFRSTDVKFVL